MPLPSSINDLSTTPASNSPAGSESPTLTDDYLRYYASYIAALRDVVLSGTASLTTLNLAYTGTLTGGTGVLNIGSGQIYKDASGNFGLGTTTPAAKFHMVGQIARIQDTQGAIQLFKDATPTKGARLAFNTAATDSIALGVYNGSAWNDALVVDASGNVGIGTTTPSSIGLFAAVKNAAGVTVAGVSNSNSAASDGAKLSTLFGATQIGAYGHYWTGSAFVNDLNFYSTLTLSMGVTERMRIDSSGNVGIGTAAPSQKLHSRGSARIDGVAYFHDATDYARFGYMANPFMATGSGNRSDMFLVADANLLFGSNGATERLRIKTSGGVVFAPMGAPASPQEGEMYYDTTAKKHYGWNGTSWNAFY